MKNILLSIIASMLMLSYTPTALSYTHTIHNQTNDGTSPGGDIEVIVGLWAGSPEQPDPIQIAPGQSGRVKSGASCLLDVNAVGKSGVIKGIPGDFWNVTRTGAPLAGLFEGCANKNYVVKHVDYAVMPPGSPEKVKGGRLKIELIN